MQMRTSAAGRKALAAREGVRLSAYRDSVGVLTIGIGHTSVAGPPKVTPGLTITRDECDAIFARDLAKYEATVAQTVTAPVTQSQFDAMVSLCYNIGQGAFIRSSVARKLNVGDVQGAADAFLAFDKAGGRVLPGLATRRRSERAQFLGDKQSRAGKVVAGGSAIVLGGGAAIQAGVPPIVVLLILAAIAGAAAFFIIRKRRK